MFVCSLWYIGEASGTIRPTPIADRWPVHPRLQRTKNAHDLLKALRGDSNIAKWKWEKYNKIE